MSAQAMEGRQWWLYLCSDCDTDGGALIMLVPEGRNPESSCGVDHCLGCGSYLSYLQKGQVEVTGNSLVHLALREPAVEDDEELQAEVEEQLP